MTISNAINNVQFTSVNIVTFTSNGTYTPPANLLWAQVECVGGGGGGGGVANSTGLTQNGGGGGGGGEYRRITASRTAIAPSTAIVVGAGGAGGPAGPNNGVAGGNTSFGAICVANGGGAGAGAASAANGLGGSGGNGGVGTFFVRGNDGNIGSRSNTNTEQTYTQTGGNSFYGFGGYSIAGFPGQGGNLYGGGGAGGRSYASNGAYAGGNGAAGIVIITEYLAS